MLCQLCFESILLCLCKSQAYNKLCSQNKDYAHELTVLLEHLEVSGCSIRESDYFIRIIILIYPVQIVITILHSTKFEIKLQQCTLYSYLVNFIVQCAIN